MHIKSLLLSGWLVIGISPISGQLTTLLPELERIEAVMEYDPVAAGKSCDSLLKLAGSPLEKAYINFTLSDAFYYMENIRGSTTAAAEALKYMPANFPVDKKIMLYNAQGQNLDMLGQLAASIKHYKKGIVLAKEIRDSIELSDLYYNIALVYDKQLAYDQSLCYFDSSYQIDLITKDSSKISHVLRTIGFTQLRYYDYESAAENLQEALLYSTQKDPAQTCVVYTSLGTLYEKQQRVDSTFHYLQLARSCYQSIEDLTTLHYLYKLSGEYYRMTGDTLRAIADFDSSADISQQIGDEEGRIIARLLAIELKNDPTYLPQLETLLDQAADYKLTRVLSRGYALYADQLEAQKNYQAALEARKIATDYREGFTKLSNQRMVQGQDARFELFRKQQQLETAEAKLASQQARWLAFGCGVLVLIAGVFGWYRYRQKKEALLRRQEQLKKESELQQRIVEVEAQAFRAQMKPHFIFNVLNSVKGLIVTGRDQEAALYISRFAKLVRNVLDQSRGKTISLFEELSTLKIYLQLEQQRFRDGFTYQIQYPDNLDAESVAIPAVIIQPFVENCIWHGFKRNRRENKIKINISVKDDEYLIIRIEDNGIGRQAATSTRKLSGHHSHGIDITRERLANFAEKDDLNTVCYEDLHHLGKPVGTKVILTIPLRYG